MYIKNEQQLRFIRPKVSHAPTQDILYLTTDPEVWHELASEAKAVLWAGDFVGGNDWMKIEDEALSLRDGWYRPIEQSLVYEGINLAELIRLEHTHFFRQAVRARIILEQVFNTYAVSNVILVGRSETPCRDRHRDNNKNGVFEGVLLWEAYKRGITVEQIPFETPSPESKSPKPENMSGVGERIFAFDCWKDENSSKLIAVGSPFHLIILGPFVQAWNNQAGCEGLLLNLGNSIEQRNGRAGFRLPEDTRFASLSDVSTYNQSTEYVQTQRRLLDVFNQWEKSRSRLDSTDILKNPYLNFHWTSIWNSFARLPLIVQKASEAIRIMNPDVVLTDEMASSSIRVFTEVAKQKGILTVECPHGYVGDIEEFQPHGDLYLAWGAETVSQLNQRFKIDSSPITVTGSPINERVIKSQTNVKTHRLYEETGLSPNKKTVCVVTRSIFANVWPVNIKEFFARCDEIASLALNQDIQIIIKVSPRVDHVRLYKRIFGSCKNIYVCSEYTLDELLPVIDIGVMFFYVGTASLLFLHKGIPTIFVRSKNTVTFTDSAWQVFEDNEPLSQLCNRFLYDSEARRQRLILQKQFAGQHLHIDDGNAAQRAVLNMKDALRDSCKSTKRTRQRRDILTQSPQAEPGQIGCLAIFTPQIGAVSETFITRQIDNLAPGRTVLVTGQICEGARPSVPCLVTPHSGGVTAYYSEVEEQVVQFLQQHGVTHILCEYGCYGQSIVELNRRRLHLPIFVHFLGYDASKLLRNPQMVMYYKWMGSHVTGVIAICKSMADRLVAVGISPDKIQVIPHGVEIPSAVEAQPNKQLCRFISVIRLVPKKAPLLLLQAFKKVHDRIPDCTLDIIGDGPLRQNVQQFVDSYGLSNAVTLHGNQPHEGVMAQMRNSCVYVQHSITDPQTGDAEGLPHIILEASAAGLPVVSTLHEGIVDEVQHGVTGFLVEEGDIDAMAEYMTRLAHNPQMCKTMGVAAHKKIAAEFNLPLWMQRLRAFITSSKVNDVHVGSAKALSTTEKKRIAPQVRSDRPKVSIIMSCYNCEQFLTEALDSILSQTMPNWELFCLDDGSTDATASIIAEYSARDARIKPFYFDTNEGPYVRRNFAITRANSDFIMIHDADDIMVSNKVQRLYEEIMSDTTSGIVGSGYLNFIDEFRGPEYTEKYEFLTGHTDILNGLLSERHTMSHIAVIIRKELFDAVGLYDENLWGADAFWLAKVAEYVRLTGRFQLKNLPEFLMLKRIRLDSQSHKIGLADPRSERKLYMRYYRQKLKDAVRNLESASPADVNIALKNCVCSDFLRRFRDDIEKSKAQPTDFRVVVNLLTAAVRMFLKRQYVNCVGAINNAETMCPDFVKTFKNCDLLRAMCYVALDMKPGSLKYLNREIQNHDSPAAKQFLADLGKQSVTDIENWYLENGKRYDLRVTVSTCPEQGDLSDHSNQLNRLRQQLAQRGWDGKFSSYQKFFDYVTCLRQVVAPTISVVVISWRLHPDTVKNFEVLARQRGESFELVFVDNGAKAGEFECLGPFIDTYVRLNRNTGVCTARNFGAVFANGRVLLFLDDDGIPEVDILRSYREAFDKYVAIVARGSIWPMDKNAAPYPPNRYYGERPFPYFCCGEGNSAYKASPFFLAGGWDDLISGGEGIDLARRLIEIEPDMRKQIYWPKAILYHGRSEEKKDWGNKKRLREESLERLKHKHPDYDIFQECYKKYYQRDDFLIPKDSRGWTVVDAESASGHLYHNQDLFRSHSQMQRRSGLARRVVDLNDRGKVLMTRGDSAGAQTAFKAALEIDPSFVEAHNNLGLLCWKMGDVRGAMRCFVEAFRLNPTDYSTVSNICRLYRHIGWTADAKALERRCLCREVSVSGMSEDDTQPSNTMADQQNHISQSGTERLLSIQDTKNDISLNVQVVGSKYGRCAVALDLIPFGSTVISAGVGEDISADLELINLKGCNVIGIDPTVKAKRYIQRNKNEHFHFMQKALAPEGDGTIRVYKNRNPAHVSDSITPHHHAVSPGEFYESQAVSVQDLLHRYNNVSFLKMDIEGAEYPVLNSVCKLNIPQIYVAFHGSITNHTISDTIRCIERLTKMGYVVVHRIGRLDQLIDILFVHQECLSGEHTVEINVERLQTATCSKLPNWENVL